MWSQTGPFRVARNWPQAALAPPRLHMSSSALGRGAGLARHVQKPGRTWSLAELSAHDTGPRRPGQHEAGSKPCGAPVHIAPNSVCYRFLQCEAMG